MRERERASIVWTCSVRTKDCVTGKWSGLNMYAAVNKLVLTVYSLVSVITIHCIV